MPDTDRQHEPSTPYRYYVVFLLALIYTVSSIDRTLVSIVAEPIKHEFSLSDSELGLLTGLMFAISYSICGIPLGFLADRYRRTRVLSAVVAIWSSLTFVSGFATSYVALALARVGVGASEAGASPASMSLITDYFPREKRGTALSFFYLSTPIGVAAGFAFGSLIAAHYGWRAAFFIAGFPGLLLSLLVLLTIREPERGRYETAKPTLDRPSVGEVFRTLWQIRPLILLMLAGVSLVAAQAGLSSFLSPFLIRVHEIPIQQAGFALASAQIVGGAAGVIFGGILADRLAKRSVQAGPRAIGILVAASAPFAIAAMLVSDWRLSMLLLGIHFLLMFSYYGAHFATYMSLAPVRMRAALASVMAVAMTLVGYGVGPVIAGDPATAPHPLLQ